MYAPSQHRTPSPILTPHFSARVTASLVICLLLIPGLRHCIGQITSEESPLDFNKPVSLLLHQGQPTLLRLDAEGSEAEIIVLDAAAQDVSFRLLYPDGTTIQPAHHSIYGWAAIPFATNKQSQLQLQLSIEDAVESLPGIRVRVERFPIPLTTLAANRLAADAFSSAQALHRSLQGEDVRKAILAFQQAADDWRGCGNRRAEALALGGKVESQIELSRYPEALSTLAQAFGLTREEPYIRGWLNHLAARVYLDQWEPKPAKPFALEALRLGTEIGDTALIALAHTDLTGVAMWSLDPDARQIDDQAHAEALAAGVPQTVGLERQWSAWIEENDEHDARAASLMGEAEGYFRRSGDVRTGLEVTGQVAQAIRLTGDLYSGLTKLLELESLTRATGNLVDYGILAQNLGEIHSDLGKPGFAAAYYQLAEKAYSHAHFRRGLMGIYGDLCETNVRLNRLPKAISDCKAYLALARQTQEPVSIGSAEYRLGLADRKAGRLKQAFADFTEAAKHSHVLDDPRRESQERIQLGGLLEQSGKQQEALVEFLRAESLTQNVNDPAILLEAQYSVARWYAHHGQYDDARARLQPALDRLEAARQIIADSTLQATYFAAQRKCYELAVDLRMAEFAHDPAGGSDALALELSEQSRARGLLDAQSARRGRREHPDVQAHLIQSDITLDRAFDRRLKLLVNGGAPRDLQASTTELTQALSGLERAEEVAQTVASDATKPGATMSAMALEGASAESTFTFFEYALGEERSYLWVLQAGRRKTFVLPPRRQLESMVRRWRVEAASVEDSESTGNTHLRALSAALSCALLKDSVEPGMARIVVVPDGALAMLPFAALPEKGCSGTSKPPLVLKHEITTTPSLSIFFAERFKTEKSAFHGEVAIVADPIFDFGDPRAATLTTASFTRRLQPPPRETTIALPRLLDAGYEAGAIQQAVARAAGKDRVFLAQGFDANLETVLSPVMRRYRVWHFATHGVYDETMPEFSGLVFSLVGPDGKPRLGFLKAQDIAKLNVSAELVVLSACDSAAGQSLSGEGVMGLSYSFLHAGAKQVIATLWSVDDARSRDLMVVFYKELIRNGGNTAAALRQSQLAIMRQPQTSAPYYWAGFGLTSLGE